MPTRPLARVLLAVTVLSPAAVRADDWSITTADFRTQAVVLRGLSPAGVHVTAADGSADRTVPLEQFVSAQRPGSAVAAAAAAKFTLTLSDGDRLVGEPSGAAGESLTWAEPLVGPVAVPFAQLVGMGRRTIVAAADERPKQDLVTLANGDTVGGVFTGVGDGKLTVQQPDGGSTAVPLEGVARVAFAATGGMTPGAARAFRVRLVDGSSLTATAVDVAAEGATGGADGWATLAAAGKGARPVRVRLADVLAVEQLNGPVGWLSSRTPTESVQVPYVGGAEAWPARFDAAVDGSPLVLGGRPVDHGIGVHAYSRLTFAVDPGWTAFRTEYAIDSRRDAPRLLADVTVRIKVDGRVVHEQAHVRAGTTAPVVRVDLGGAKTLTLECDYGPGGDTQAHLDWIRPALLRDGDGRP